jgi:electron transfer flavoprotein alpha subunit
VLAILALVGDLHYLRPNVAAVLVHIDLDGDRPHPSSLVALAAGRQVASSWGATLYAALIAYDPSEAPGAAPAAQATKVPPLDTTQHLARTGADKIIVALTDTPVAPLWATIGSAWQGVIDHLRPRLVLFGADAPAAAELAPRTGARIGARLLMRARSLGGDDIELRDRDGGYVRAADSGAAVALVGRAEKPLVPAVGVEHDIDVVVLELPGGADARLELATSTAAEVSHTLGTLIALGDDVVTDKKVMADAKKLAVQLGAQIVGTRTAGKTVPKGAVIHRATPLAPEVCIAIGNAQLDLAGSTSLVRIGGTATKTADGALPGLADVGVRELVKRLGDA